MSVAFIGAPKRDWEKVLARLDVPNGVDLDEFGCPVCGERMVMESRNHALALQTPDAIIACLRCVCKAKDIAYPESVDAPPS